MEKDCKVTCLLIILCSGQPKPVSRPLLAVISGGHTCYILGNSGAIHSTTKLSLLLGINTTKMLPKA